MAREAAPRRERESIVESVYTKVRTVGRRESERGKEREKDKIWRRSFSLFPNTALVSFSHSLRRLTGVTYHSRVP
jgi:hypothetical protein